MLKQQFYVPSSFAALGSAAEMLQATIWRASSPGHSVQVLRLQPSTDAEFGG